MSPLKQSVSTTAKPYAPIDDPLMHEDEKRKTADRARARHRFRLERLEREKQEQEERLAQKIGVVKSIIGSSTGDLKKAVIQAALERAKAGRARITEKHNNADL